MADYSEYIDAYFNQALNKEEIAKFEQKLASDRIFAEEVAFHLSTKQVLKEELYKDKKERFKLLLKEGGGLKREPVRGQIQKLWIYRTVAAAAIIILAVSAWYLFPKPITVQQRAENYIQQKLTTLSVTMGQMDSVQEGLKLYNEGKLSASLTIFQSILQRDTANYSAKKYLGIVYLRLANYEKALQYFQLLENYPLYSNPAIFYQALTLMKRNQSIDKSKARQLLQKVVDQNFEGKQTAMQWLKEWQ